MNNRPMKPNIRSEINPLRLVITHRPGNEHEYITPSNLNEKVEVDKGFIDNQDYLLFDDIIYVPDASKEHDSLYNILHHFTDGNCYEFTDLLNVIINDFDVKEKLLNECILLEKELYGNTINIELLLSLDNKQLIETLLSGYIRNNQVLKYPIPNLIFTRDIAVCIGQTILITWSKKHVRRRENILAKYIFENFKPFHSLSVYDFHSKHPDLSIEGGDILIFDDKRICIGLSERTPLESVIKITPLLYAEGFEKIIAIDLPKKRALMHLDTIFTRISNNEVLVFPPILDKSYREHLNRTYLFKNNSTKPELINENFLNVLNNEGVKINLIKCGSSSTLIQESEQWTDGANAFTLSPGKIIGYDCNTHTLEELKQSGYKIISSNDYINNYSKYNKSKNKFIITLKGSELLKGRGGPRCLTLPLFRL